MKTVLLFLIGLLSAVAAHADRDIVYSARYYAPPGSHRTSHYHIYRINSDGSGKTQLTFGAADDVAPRWSPDGRQVTFIEYDVKSSASMLWEMDQNGGRRHVLKRLADDWEPAPPSVPGYRLENVVSERGDPTQYVLVNLKTGRRLTLPVPDHEEVDDVLLPMPGHTLIYAANNRDSTIGTDYLYYQLDPDAGILHYLTEGRFLAWCPDGSQFCIAPGRDTTSYEKRRQPYAIEKGASKDEISDADYRQVWSAPLYVRAAAGGPMRQLTPRLSIVAGADWRKVK